MTINLTTPFQAKNSAITAKLAQINIDTAIDKIEITFTLHDSNDVVVGTINKSEGFVDMFDGQGKARVDLPDQVEFDNTIDSLYTLCYKFAIRNGKLPTGVIV